MKLLTFLLLSILTVTLTYAQQTKEQIKKQGNGPVFFVDSIKVTKKDIIGYDPKQIASVFVYKEKSATIAWIPC